MHATYLFRAKTDDIDEAVLRFESWIAEWGDENNWWELLYAVNSKGQKRILVRDLDWKDRAEGLSRDCPTADDMKGFAWIQMAYDSEVFDELDPITIPGRVEPEEKKKMVEKMKSLSLQEWPRFFIERALGQMKKFCDSTTPDDLLGNDHMKSYRWHRIVTTVERVIQSVADERSEPPFTNLSGTPYSYPAFELCGADENGETILAVDIHT